MLKCSDIIIVLLYIDRAQALLIHCNITAAQANPSFCHASISQQKGDPLNTIRQPFATSDWLRVFDGEMKACVCILCRFTEVESSFITSAISYLSPGTSFCNMLSVSHALHRITPSNSALWPSGASICSERALYSFRLPYMCVCTRVCSMSLCMGLYIFASVAMCMCNCRMQNAPVCICVFILLDSWAPPAAVELVISRSGWRAMETNSTDVTSPPGRVPTENITATPLRDCLQ